MSFIAATDFDMVIVVLFSGGMQFYCYCKFMNDIHHIFTHIFTSFKLVNALMPFPAKQVKFLKVMKCFFWSWNLILSELEFNLPSL